MAGIVLDPLCFSFLLLVPLRSTVRPRTIEDERIAAADRRRWWWRRLWRPRVPFVPRAPLQPLHSFVYVVYVDVRACARVRVYIVHTHTHPRARAHATHASFFAGTTLATLEKDRTNTLRGRFFSNSLLTWLSPSLSSREIVRPFVSRISPKTVDDVYRSDGSRRLDIADDDDDNGDLTIENPL